MSARLRRQFLTKVLICLAAFGLVGWADYLLGEINISPLYFFLVAYAAWQFDSLTAGAIAALMAVLGRFFADDFKKLEYPIGWLVYENGAMRFIIFWATAYAILSYRRTLEAHRRRIESLRKLLPICHCCGSVRGPDGHWLPFDRLSRSPFPQVVECPACADKSEKPSA
ncbi:MAG: hypothetical protein WCL04_06330 [Verrucomicrobiota bacterium]